MISYYWILDEDTLDKVWIVDYTPYYRHFMFYGSNEAVMFVPGTYAEMMEDYD